MHLKIFYTGLLSLTLLTTPLRAYPAEPGGTVLPDFGDSSGSLISPVQEQALGEAFMRSIRSQVTLVHDPSIDDYVSRLGHELVLNSDEPGRPFTFFVVQDGSVNAFAGPGGYIGVHTGLILTARNESELAGVMAHEIAHVTQRHLVRAYESANQMSLPTAAAMLASILLGVATGNADAGIAGVMATQAGNIQRQLDFTRANEKEADRIGIRTLARSGIDPYGMPSFFERLQQSTRLYGNNIPEFLSTHPVTSNRVAESMQRADEYGRGKRSDSTAFQLIQARLQVLSSEKPQVILGDYQAMVKKRDHRDADLYGLALASQQVGDYKTAKPILLKLLKGDPDRLLYQITVANLELESGHTEKAVQRYQQTLKLYPGDLVVGQYYAAALILTGKAEQARKFVVSALRDERARTPAMYELWAKAASIAGPAWETNEATAELYYMMGHIRPAIDQLQQALVHKGISEYQRTRMGARLESWKQLIAEYEEGH